MDDVSPCIDEICLVFGLYLFSLPAELISAIPIRTFQVHFISPLIIHISLMVYKGFVLQRENALDGIPVEFASVMDDFFGIFSQDSVKIVWV